MKTENGTPLGDRMTEWWRELREEKNRDDECRARQRDAYQASMREFQDTVKKWSAALEKAGRFITDKLPDGKTLHDIRSNIGQSNPRRDLPDPKSEPTPDIDWSGNPVLDIRSKMR